ncbi:hypothetical protein C8F04DRAFT_1270575 [Mycena alexandri]|uniref:Uncharacterized protein n=1 Tax=Mycena alexandri TaxID=1745969 RepID=A0AAD6SC43_9AGAR|nr:hypothetical protein C8F04DRAFT_1270575 [Mycena alexandri]
MIFAAIAKDIYSRLLDRIYASSSLLFAASILDRDFVHTWTGRRCNGSGDSLYTLHNGTPFEPGFVGSVDSADFGGVGSTVVLRLPLYATERMTEFFEKQLSCLTSVVAARCELTPNVRCEDVIPWNYLSSSGVGRIHVSLRPDTPMSKAVCMPVAWLRLWQTRRCTAGRCLDNSNTGLSPPSSVCSTSSSSTLSSTDDYTTSDSEVRSRDLLIVQCKLTCRDFPRPNGLVVRVFSLDTTKIDIIV